MVSYYLPDNITLPLLNDYHHTRLKIVCKGFGELNLFLLTLFLMKSNTNIKTLSAIVIVS